MKMVICIAVLLLICHTPLHKADPQYYYNGHDSPENYESLEDSPAYGPQYYKNGPHYPQNYGSPEREYRPLQPQRQGGSCSSELLCPRQAGIRNIRQKRGRHSVISHGSLALPAMKDQGDLGVCWAFSVMASIERQISKNYVSKDKQNKRVALSEQYLIDCCIGCFDNPLWAYIPWCEVEDEGAFRNDAFDFLIQNGVVEEDDYGAPYSAKRGTCNTNARKSDFKITGKILVDQSDEEEMISEIDAGNYISIDIWAGDAFGSYFEINKNGILPQTLCGEDGSTNHAVLLVGYGTDTINNENKGFWLIRNSWGRDYANAGNFKMLRTGQNTCRDEGIIPEIKHEPTTQGWQKVGFF